MSRISHEISNISLSAVRTLLHDTYAHDTCELHRHFCVHNITLYGKYSVNVISNNELVTADKSIIHFGRLLLYLIF